MEAEYRNSGPSAAPGSMHPKDQSTGSRRHGPGPGSRQGGHGSVPRRSPPGGHRAQAAGLPDNRILSRNANGTIAMTCQPSNESELQLYRVLQRANLLAYYDTFICQGGDDVHQLCEAGEEEFLEIMALVGMASKPLHVRRLQKSLQEWVQNPVAFLATSMFAAAGFPNGQGPPPPPPPPHSQGGPPGLPHGYPSVGPMPPSPAALAAQMRSAESHHREHRELHREQQQREQSQPGPSSGGGGGGGSTGGIAFPSMVHDGHPSSSSGGGGGGGSTRPPSRPQARSPVNLSTSMSPVASGGSGSRRRMTTISPPPLPVTMMMGVGSHSSQQPGPSGHSTPSSNLLQRERQTPPTPLHGAGNCTSGGGLGTTVSAMSTSGTSSPSPTPNGSKATMSPEFAPDALRLLLNHSQLVAQATGAAVAAAAAAGLGGSGRESRGLITNEYGQPASPISLTPVLIESQIARLAHSAEGLVKSLPPMDPKLASNKKKMSKELEFVMNLPEEDPRRMDEIRKYAAIYGRFDCKRKPEKPLTLHEVSVNEAAAQICRHIPALLTRRDELFPLARQVVRDSGYQYSKGHSRSTAYGPSSKRSYEDGGTPGGTGSNSGDGSSTDGMDGSSSNKRHRTESAAGLQASEDERRRRQERLDTIMEQLKMLSAQQDELKMQLQLARELHNFAVVSQVQNELDAISTQQMQLINEQSELVRLIRRLEKYLGIPRAYSRLPHDDKDRDTDGDSDDSQYSLYSNDENSVDVSPPGDLGANNSGGRRGSSDAINEQNSISNINAAINGNNGNSSNGHGGDRGGSVAGDGQIAQPSTGSAGPSDFSKLLPAKKAGNLSGASQLTRQLAAETLLDEGLRVVREFNTGLGHNGQVSCTINGTPIKMENGHGFQGTNGGNSSSTLASSEGIDLSVRTSPKSQITPTNNAPSSNGQRFSPPNAPQAFGLMSAH